MRLWEDAYKAHAHETYAREMHVYEVYAAVSAHLGGIRLGGVRSVRSSLPVNVYGNFDFRK